MDRPSPPSAVDAGPFALGDGPTAVLCLHGLTGTPWEVRPLAEALAGAGHRAVGPLLAGHGADLAALERTTWRDWYDSAELAFDALSPGAGPRIVLGFSMGALLSLRLAALHADAVDAVIALSVPLSFPGWKRAAIGVLARLRASPGVGRLVGHHPKAGGPDVRVRRAALENPSLRQFPYPTLRELVALQDETRACLPRVRAPLLLLHGGLDHAAAVEDSAVVAQAVASASVRRVVLARSFHHVAMDLDRDRARDEVMAFVAAIANDTRSDRKESTA